MVGATDVCVSGCDGAIASDLDESDGYGVSGAEAFEEAFDEKDGAIVGVLVEKLDLRHAHPCALRFVVVLARLVAFAVEGTCARNAGRAMGDAGGGVLEQRTVREMQYLWAFLVVRMVMSSWSLVR
jgi:hypothetical protein